MQEDITAGGSGPLRAGPGTRSGAAEFRMYRTSGWAQQPFQPCEAFLFWLAWGYVVLAMYVKLSLALCYVDGGERLGLPY